MASGVLVSSPRANSSPRLRYGRPRLGCDVREVRCAGVRWFAGLRMMQCKTTNNLTRVERGETLSGPQSPAKLTQPPQPSVGTRRVPTVTAVASQLPPPPNRAPLHCPPHSPSQHSAWSVAIRRRARVSLALADTSGGRRNTCRNRDCDDKHLCNSVSDLTSSPTRAAATMNAYK